MALLIAVFAAVVGAGVAAPGGAATPEPARLLVPMDSGQPQHCRAYGLTWQTLIRLTAAPGGRAATGGPTGNRAAGYRPGTAGAGSGPGTGAIGADGAGGPPPAIGDEGPGVAWLLNYRGGSFLLPDDPWVAARARELGVAVERLSASEVDGILGLIAVENMDVVPLVRAPRIALYLENPAEAGKDVVARTLGFAGIAFETVGDAEIIAGRLADFDWLHLHHKDLTGQGHKSGPNRHEQTTATRLGFAKVWQMKQQVADRVRQFVRGGGFVFAMCSAAETLDVSLAAFGLDIAPASVDGDGAEAQVNARLDFTRSLAFTGFVVDTSSAHIYSDIDVPSAGPHSTYRLFEFSAQVDPVPCLLNQNHVSELSGFGGETTSFRKSLVKKTVTILAENSDGMSVRYLTGSLDAGIFSYLGGHMPGDCDEGGFVRAAPGFRLILNNVLFPAARTRRRKT